MTIPRDLSNLAPGANTSGVLQPSKGGTGVSSLTANNVILGNGTSTVQFVAPGTTGNVLTSNGTTWASTAPTSAGVNIQTFTSSGTWTKPSGYAAGSRVLIQAWGGGGSGGRADSSGGGGGGGYIEKWVLLSAMGSTETITVAAGGASVTSGTGNGASGGNTTVGSVATAYGGGGGQGNAGTIYVGGGGGSPFAAGTVGTNSGSNLARLGGGGYRSGYANATIFVRSEQSGTVQNSDYSNDATNIWGGGGGGGGFESGCSNFDFKAGCAVYGGGGGGSSSSYLTAGTSVLGGNGGAGTTGANATAGTAPAGGGGGSRSSYNSGAGARGQVTITVFPA